jgi:hypothetical protein
MSLGWSHAYNEVTPVSKFSYATVGRETVKGSWAFGTVIYAFAANRRPGFISHSREVTLTRDALSLLVEQPRC